MIELLNTERLATPSSCCKKLSVINARIGDRSNPPSNGMIPLNAFRYGSVIELILLNIGLLQSKFGNQLSKTLTINTNE